MTHFNHKSTPTMILIPWLPCYDLLFLEISVSNTNVQYNSGIGYGRWPSKHTKNLKHTHVKHIPTSNTYTHHTRTCFCSIGRPWNLQNIFIKLSCNGCIAFDLPVSHAYINLHNHTAYLNCFDFQGEGKALHFWQRTFYIGN